MITPIFLCLRDQIVINVQRVFNIVCAFLSLTTDYFADSKLVCVPVPSPLYVCVFSWIVLYMRIYRAQHFSRRLNAHDF